MFCQWSVLHHTECSVDCVLPEPQHHNLPVPDLLDWNYEQYFYINTGITPTCTKIFFEVSPFLFLVHLQLHLLDADLSYWIKNDDKKNDDITRTILSTSIVSQSCSLGPTQTGPSVFQWVKNCHRCCLVLGGPRKKGSGWIK